MHGQTGQSLEHPVVAMLRELRGGEALIDLGHQLASLVGAVRSTGKSGSLTIQIHVAPAKGSGALIVTDKVNVKEPEIDRDATIFFADDSNILTRRDPRQPQLPGTERSEIRSFRVAD